MNALPGFRLSFPMLLAPLLSRRRESWALLGAGAFQLGLTASGLPAWNCPFHSVLGIPCPGCGLSTAVCQLLRGQVSAALQTHVFAPLVLISLLLIALAAILPPLPQQRLVSAVAFLEAHTALTPVLLVALHVYWLARLFWAA